MRDTLESFGAAAAATGGLALALVPVVVIIGPMFLLMKAGRGLWSKGTESKRLKERQVWMETETDPVIRDYLDFTFDFRD